VGARERESERGSEIERTSLWRSNQITALDEDTLVACIYLEANVAIHNLRRQVLSPSHSSSRLQRYKLKITVKITIKIKLK
jgi:hypothetical protein